MVDQQIINILVGIVGTAGGWWMKVMHESLKDLQREDKQLADKVARIEILVAGDYVKKGAFDKLADAIFAKLDRIEDKLDGKVDKP